MLAATAALACAPAWDAREWARAQPELAGRELGHLAEATPYALVAGENLVFFWCRWRTDRPVRVALPRAAGDAQRALLRRALEAWEQAIPGLHFAQDDRAPQLRIHFSDEGEEGARSAADCAVDVPVPEAGPLPARLVRAEIWLRREEGDAWGRPVPLGEPELLGSAVHEIGHALGLQGHARRADTALSRNADRVRRIGARLARGGALREPALAALYALPAGSVVERRPLAPGAAAEIARQARWALQRSAGRSAVLELRLGDRTERIQWVDYPDLGYYLRDPQALFRGAIGLEESLAWPRPASARP